MHLLVTDGNCFIIDDGWLDFECMYKVMLFGFLKGKCFPVFKLKNASKKSASMRFISIVIDIPSSLDKLIMSFLNLSSFVPLTLCTMGSPPSLCNPTSLKPKRGLILFRKYNPTSSHSSALSKLPIVTSNNRSPSFFTQAPLPSNNKDFHAWGMMLIIFPSLLIKDIAKLIDLKKGKIEKYRI